MINGWQILLTISIATYAISVLLQKTLLKEPDSDPIAFCIVFQILTGLTLGGYVFIRGVTIPNLIPFIPNIVLPILLYGVGNALIFQALKRIDASEFTIIFSSRVFFTIASAILFLKEPFSSVQFIGTMFIILSIVLISWEKKSFSFHSGYVLAIFAAICYGMEFVNDAYVITKINVSFYFALVLFAQGLFIGAVYRRPLMKIKTVFRVKTLARLIVFILLYAIQAVTIFEAYKVGKNAAQIASINQTTTIMTVILAVVFLKERKNLNLFQK